MKLASAPRKTPLKTEQLKWTCDPELFELETTEKAKPIEGIIGQERALKALKLGVELKSQGYNIFITGLSGTGKFTTVKKMLEAISPSCPKLFDYAYVNNFDDRDRPILLTFPSGKAILFQKDLQQTIQYLQDNIPQVLENEPFTSKKGQLIKQFQQKHKDLFGGFEEELKKEKLTLGELKVGDSPRPEIFAVINNEPVMVQNLNEFVSKKVITEKRASEIREKYSEYQQKLQAILKTGWEINKEFSRELESLEKESVSKLINVALNDIKKKYKIKNIKEYIDLLEENILKDLEIFKGVKPAQQQTENGDIIDYLKDYEVNIILDNSKVKECPVVIETSPTHTNLFGNIEKFNDGYGGWYADYSKIKAGSLLRANGGYLVINAIDAFSEPGVWKSLKRVLLYGNLEIQDVASVFQITTSVLKPEPIPINTKIIFIGNNYIYSYLSQAEDDFNKIFKVKAEFDYEMNRSKRTISEYVQFIKKLVQSEDLLDFDKSGIAKITEHGARYAGDQNKLTTRFSYLADLIRESVFWAKDNGDKLVNAYHVNQAYHSMVDRQGLYESKMKEMIDEGTILIDTKGKRVGQINGLAVYGNGNFSFGKPSRITATTSLGNGNIINVEREAGLSGNTHNKGILIITGYFRETFGKKIPLSFTASIVFEQGYGTIDGDSASITEICALLSSLSCVPIKQNYAITGSVNQKGDIQPIGGVNEKIEGFYEVCKLKGFTKDQGVIIPKQNIKDLMLKDEVIESVKKKEFRIYAVEKVSEAIEILTGVKAGEPNEHGHYPANTLFGTVEKTLKEMRQAMKGQQAPSNAQPAQTNTQTKKTKKKK
ncbi:MAG: AAA family ATPase [Melioribacteraceae bacterium]|nr:AAA family ATPase [Melioribacteraceae bacterium]